MNKNVITSLLVSGLFLTSAITSISVQAAPNYWMTCTGTANGSAWIKVADNVREALNLSSDCMQQGGTPEINS